MKRVTCLIAVCILAGLVLTGLAETNKPPSQSAIDFAKQTSNLLTATIFGALIQEFNETNLDNVEQGIQSIGLVFDDKNPNMRLVGTFQPLSANDYPQDSFEYTALSKALSGEPYTNVEKVQGDWFYRRSIPVSNFRPECVMCHANFPSAPSDTDWMGALMLRVPIK